MLRALVAGSNVDAACLPLVGRHLEGLCVWLRTRGYPPDALRRRMKAAVELEIALRRHGVLSLREVTAPVLRSYAPARRRSNAPPLGALVRSLAHYLEERGELATPPMTPTQTRVEAYRRHLMTVRGLSAGTITAHAATAKEFLHFLGHDASPHGLRLLRRAEVEAFVAKVGQRVGRDRLSHVTSELRTFLRFLALTGEGPQGLDAQIDSPRVFRGERLPRALPWEMVRAFLAGIDRQTAKGRRDYAMFLLMATCGLRAGEVCALELDHLAWREGLIRVPGSKTGAHLLLPLTDQVATAILAYLRQDRPAVASRRLFLRVEAPVGPLGTAGVGNAFTKWARHSRVPIPKRGGPHCLRHSLAMRLLRQGVTLKEIGDLLGHRSFESTGVYLRLGVDDLRGVALALPATRVEVRS